MTQVDDGAIITPTNTPFPFSHRMSVFSFGRTTTSGEMDYTIHVASEKRGDEFLGSSSVLSFPRLKHLTFLEMQEWENWEAKKG